MTAVAPRARRAARVLLVDRAGRVLLLRGVDPARPEAGAWWMTPGGGLEPGESFSQGAARELFEETGLRCPAEALGAPVHVEDIAFSFGGRSYEQHQEFFLLRVDSHEVDHGGFDDVERASVLGHGWFGVDGLDGLAEPVHPAALAGLLRGLGVVGGC